MNLKRIMINAGGAFITTIGANLMLGTMPIKGNMSEKKSGTRIDIKDSDTNKNLFSYSTDEPIFKK